MGEYEIIDDFNWDNGMTEYRVIGEDYRSGVMYSNREAMQLLSRLEHEASSRESWATPLNH